MCACHETARILCGRTLGHGAFVLGLIRMSIQVCSLGLELLGLATVSRHVLERLGLVSALSLRAVPRGDECAAPVKSRVIIIMHMINAS